MSLRKAIYIILGCIGLILGAVGVIVPMLPAFPFLLLAAFSFARGSERLHSWFISTRLYKNNLETYVRGQGMTRRQRDRAHPHQHEHSCNLRTLLGVEHPDRRLGIPHSLFCLRRENVGAVKKCAPRFL